MGEREVKREVGRLLELQRLIDKIECKKKHASESAYTTAIGILVDYGDYELGSKVTENIGGGSLRKVDNFQYLKTPSMPLELVSQRGELYLKQNIDYEENGFLIMKSIDIVFVEGEKNEEITLYSVKKDSVTNIEGELELPAEFNALNDLFQLMKDHYQKTAVKPVRQKNPFVSSLNDFTAL